MSNDAHRAKWGVEAGQVWKLGEHVIVCGDACLVRPLSLLFHGQEKAALVFTSPPYGQQRDYECDRPGLVRDALGLILCARRGLSEGELLHLLKAPGQAQLAVAVWAPFRAALQESLIDCAGILILSEDQSHWKEELPPYPKSEVLVRPVVMKQIVQTLSEMLPIE